MSKPDNLTPEQADQYVRDARAVSLPAHDAFGPEAVDKLARWAIDVLCGGELPAKGNTYAYAAKVPWRDINAGRQLLEDAGIDWRKLHAGQVEQYRELAARTDAKLRAEKIAEGQR